MRIISMCLAIAVSTPVYCQKIGHINYGNLIESMPQRKSSDEKLKVYQDSLEKALQEAIESHQSRIADNQAKFNAGELSRVVAEQINQNLNEEQENLRRQQSQSEFAILQRREQLLAPIIELINKTIADYGRENGYDFIFDESSGFILYDRPSDDLTDAIRDRVVD